MSVADIEMGKERKIGPISDRIGPVPFPFNKGGNKYVYDRTWKKGDHL